MYFALVDCNNFFVSCERAFQPDLEGKAVVVLSNNDGCIVARSNESKAMGIKMGTPIFKVKNLVDSGKLIVRSSNYTLYGDLSARVMSILREYAPELQVYSIDEAFMVFDGVSLDKVIDISKEVVLKIRKWVGLPVSVGIAPTKTLAKIANHFAKKYPGYKGVCSIENEEKRAKALSLTPIDDVWGIGWRGAPKLMAIGVKTALDFAEKKEEWVRKRMGVTGVRTWLELRGTAAVGDEAKERRQTICTSRSFADMIEDPDELTLRISDFAGICAKKLRQEGSLASTVGLFMQTNRFREDLDQYYPQASLSLDTPSSSTTEIVGAALKIMKGIFRKGYKYKRAGVIVMDIIAADELQGSLFDENSALREKEDKISEIMDSVNGNGRNLLRLAVQRPGHYADGIRSEHLSKRYSTSWDEMIEVH